MHIKRLFYLLKDFWIYERYAIIQSSLTSVTVQSLWKLRNLYAESTICDHIKRSLDFGMLPNPLTTISTTLWKFLQRVKTLSIPTFFLAELHPRSNAVLWGLRRPFQQVPCDNCKDQGIEQALAVALVAWGPLLIHDTRHCPTWSLCSDANIYPHSQEFWSTLSRRES